MYRITIKPTQLTNTIELTIEEVKYSKVVKVVTNCHVNVTGGNTHYMPIPPKEDFGAWSDDIHDEVRNIIHAWFDGLKQETNYSWIYDES